MKSEVKIIELENLNFTKVAYYTLKFADEEQNELDKFYNNYHNEYSESVNFIKMWIAVIGEKFGATSQYFRTEDNASALPPNKEAIEKEQIEYVDLDPYQKKTKLRLYCIVLSEKIVILINGGVKESQATRNSPTCWKQFMFASNISSQIKRMELNGALKINDKSIITNKSFSLSYKK